MLLSHNYRIKYLEKVLKSADRYLNHGVSKQERDRLLRPIKKDRKLESYVSGEERKYFDLE